MGGIFKLSATKFTKWVIMSLPTCPLLHELNLEVLDSKVVTAKKKVDPEIGSGG